MLLIYLTLKLLTGFSNFLNVSGIKNDFIWGFANKVKDSKILISLLKMMLAKECISLIEEILGLMEKGEIYPQVNRFS